MGYVCCLSDINCSPPPAAAAHFSFCRNLLEHTVSAENLNYRLQRNTGSCLTWHDGRSQRSAGGRTVKLLQQPGTEGSQVPACREWTFLASYGALAVSTCTAEWPFGIEGAIPAHFQHALPPNPHPLPVHEVSQS
ncbi:30S ribosomal protein S11 [Platysternon megacephalum]|uniref:30S ribosomal protein S11 n=1 Tax=Platysternon megacephalum TaxID=55544 RepID=A0A4D9DDF5_9SAUR|nr:30S ribosomal protein S11 [Platysternon megacephalum]